MQICELRIRQPAFALQGFLLSLCEQLAQYQRGLEANFAVQLTRIPCKGLRSALRYVSAPQRF